MFKKRVVIGIDREKLVFVKVSTFGKGKIVKSLVSEYNFVNIREVVSKAKKILKFKKVRLLFADELSYVLETNIPRNLKGFEEKKYIYKLISEEIPEKLSDVNWDFKELKKIDKKSEKDNEKRILVFAPVKDLFERMVKVLTSLKVEIEAVEPETLAKKRSSNPLVGIAKKKDITGKDEEVLNLSVKDEKDLKSNEQNNGKRSKRLRWKHISYIIILLVILFTVAYLGFVYFQSIVSEEVEFSNFEDKTTHQGVEQQSTPNEGIAQSSNNVVNLADYVVFIQNNQGVDEPNKEVKEILASEGFEKITILLGDNPLELTEESKVITKKNVPIEVYETIERSLNSEYKIVLTDGKMVDEINHDIEITLGEPLIE
jgi:hypothetical protein